MASDAGYFGYGSRSAYVRFMASHGTSLLQIAEALGLTVYRMMQLCPDVDFYQYRFFDESSGVKVGNRWCNDDIEKVVDWYPTHGAKWEGWQLYLPDRNAAAIRNLASKLGIYYIPKGKRDGR